MTRHQNPGPSHEHNDRAHLDSIHEIKSKLLSMKIYFFEEIGECSRLGKIKNNFIR